MSRTYSLLSTHHAQTLEHLAFDSPQCLFVRLAATGLRADTVTGFQFHGDEFTVHHGESAGGWETSTDTYCATCHAFLWHGLDCPEDCPAATTPTTDRPERTPS